MQQQLKNDFRNVFELITQILENLTIEEIINETLKCLTAYCPYVDIQYLIDTNILELVCSKKYISDCNYSSNALVFLSQVSAKKDLGNSSELFMQRVKMMFKMIISVICEILPFEIDLNKAYREMHETEKNFINGLGVFIEKTLSNNPKFLVDMEMFEAVHSVFLFLTIHTCCNMFRQTERLNFPMPLVISHWSLFLALNILRVV